MSINDFVEMTILLCLISFSIYPKIRGFEDECVSFLFLHFMQKFKMGLKNGGKTILVKMPVDSADTLRGENFVEIALSHTVYRFFFASYVKNHFFFIFQHPRLTSTE